MEILSRYRDKNHTYCLVLCVCGVQKPIREDVIKNGETKSCGCFRKEYMSVSRKGIPAVNKTHGESKTRSVEYGTWSRVKTRCYNQKSKDYKDYGGRGIKMCDSWLNSYESFLRDMGRRPKGRYSLDRINVNGNYEPSNCRWATDKEQANNKRKYKSLFYEN